MPQSSRKDRSSLGVPCTAARAGRSGPMSMRITTSHKISLAFAAALAILAASALAGYRESSLAFYLSLAAMAVLGLAAVLIRKETALLLRAERHAEAANRKLKGEIEQRAQIEQTLRESEERFRAFMDNTPAAAFIKDEQGRYLYGNKGWAAQFGKPPEELLGQTDFDLWPDETARLFRQSDQRALSSAQTFEAVEQTRGEGPEKWFAVLKFPIQGRDGRLVGGISLDITDRVRVEQELADLNRELEARVEQRTRELEQAQAQLVRREKLLTLGQLAGGVAHEIRNPLGVVRNSIYYLRMTQTDLDSKAVECLNRIDKQIQTADRIISELLDYARQPPAEPAPFPLAEAIGHVLEGMALPEQVEIRQELAAPRLVVRADRGQVERILRNLVQNGVQAMGSQGVLTIRSQSRNGDAWIEVQDTGGGIAPEHLAAIFEPLFTTKAKGIGLGLAISKTYADMNQGRIEVDSRLGQGSTFRLVLPREELDANIEPT